MSNNKTYCFAAAMLLLASGSALAADTPLIEAREHRQQHRIIHGVMNGQLTVAETLGLARGQAAIDRMQGRAAADGRVSGLERLRIHQAQDLQSRRIYINKHDRQRRWR